MPWGRVEDDLHDNGKVATLSDRAFRAWWYSVSYCNKKRQSDPVGHLSRTEAIDLCQRHQRKPLTPKAVEAVIKELSEPTDDRDSVFWEKAGKGFIVHDFPMYGPKKEAVKTEPQDPTAAERQRRHRDKETLSRPDDRDTDRDVTRDSAVTHGVTRVHAGPVPGPVPGPGSEATEPSEPKTDVGGDTHVSRARALAVPKPGQPVGSVHAALSAEFADALGQPTTDRERKHWNATIGELARAGVKPGEPGRLVEAWQELYTVPCTIEAVANKLTTLRKPVVGVGRRSTRKESASEQIDRVFAQHGVAS